MSEEGPTLELASGTTTTAYGTVTINDAVSFETLYADSTHAWVRISPASG
jgi:hypothetical protein